MNEEDPERDRATQVEEEEEEEEEDQEGLFKANAVNEEDSERDRATVRWCRRRDPGRKWSGSPAKHDRLIGLNLPLHSI